MDVPTRIGPYVILHEIGRGGMGIVYLTREPDESTLIALKVLPDTLRDDPSRLKRFQGEAATVMRVRHPHVVPIYSVGCADGVRFIAMKYIEGRSLDLLIRDQAMATAAARDDRGPAPARGPSARIGPPISCLNESPPGFGEVGPAIGCLSEPEWVHRAVGVVENIARALDHVHAQGIVHRDVKPANILIDRFGDAWLADFGLVGDLDAPTLSQSEGILGTAQYIAPEQIKGDRGRTDHRSDLYALGVTLYELVTLRRPFDGRDTSSTLCAVAREDPEPPRRFNPRLTHDLERMILKAMAKDPDDRYQTGNAFADDLRRVRTLEPARASRLPVFGSLRRFGAKSPRLTAAIVFLVLLVLGLVESCVGGALRERQRLFDCRAEADRAFDRGDYGEAAESYRLCLKLGGGDSTVVQRLRSCQNPANLSATK